jgi:tetratricopeptide (TPR) repeat protein
MNPPQSPPTIEEAQKLQEGGQEEAAIKMLKELIEQEPKNIAAREELGDIYYAREAYKLARQQYRYIFDRRRHEVGVALKLVEVYLCIPKKVRQAYNVLRRTVQHNGDHLPALLSYANFCRVLFREEAEEVEALYEQIETLSAGDLEGELACAADHLYTEQLERAKEACFRALVLGEEDSRIYQLLSQIYLAEGLIWLAQRAAQQVLELAGPSVQAYHDLAMVYLKGGDEQAALVVLGQALNCSAEEKEQIPLLRQMATLQMQQELYLKAIESLEHLLSLDEQDLAALYSLVIAHQQVTDYQAALAILESQLLPLAGAEEGAAQTLQGLLYLQAQQPQQARTIFAALVKTDQKQADYYYYLAVAEDQLGHQIAACQAVKRALRCNRHHAGARTLYEQLHPRKKRDEKKAQSPKPFFDPLDLNEFLTRLDIQARIDKLAAYIEMRYWKERDPRGQKPLLSHHALVRVQLVMGLKDWNLNQLHQKLRSAKHGGPLRQLLKLPSDPADLPVYTTFERRLNTLGVYPLKFLMRGLVREAVQAGYIDVSNILLDTSLIAAYTDLTRFFPDSPTDYSESEAAWSYPKPWTGRVFGFKLSLATAKDGEPIDADLVTANLNDITLGKQAVRRLGRTFAPLNITIEFVIADGGYCSDPLRQLVAEVLGALPLIRFNPRRNAQRQPQQTYLDDPDQWLKAKRRLRQLIERSFAQLKRHFGLDNLRIRGLTQVAQYVLSRSLAYLACTIVAHKLGRPDLKASPRRLLYSY